MDRQAIATGRAPSAVGPYSQAIAAGDFVFCSGQVHLDPASGVLVGADIGAQTQRVLDNLAAVLEAAGLTTAESISVLAASPKELILQEAAEWSADWIVLGSHGSSGLSRFLIGSTSETVATHATCSVEVIRQKPSA